MEKTRKREPYHIKEIFDFEFTKEGMAQIASLNNGQRRYHRTEESLQQFALWKIAYEAK